MALALPFPAIDPVAIALGPIAIRWYALAYLAGILIGLVILRRLIARPGWRMTRESLDDLLFYVVLGIILGGRLGYVLFYNAAHYLEHPLQALAIWHGGMSFHGGLLGVLAVLLWHARRTGRRTGERLGDEAAGDQTHGRPARRADRGTGQGPLAGLLVDLAAAQEEHGRDRGERRGKLGSNAHRSLPSHDFFRAVPARAGCSGHGQVAAMARQNPSTGGSSR
jgi:hypothetical protein